MPTLVNAPESTITVDFGKCFTANASAVQSPIDRFYTTCAEMVKLTKPQFLSKNPVVTRLLVLGYVSSVELYLRLLFSQLVVTCPCTREKAGDKMIRFDAFEYYEKNHLAEGLFDGASFAAKEEIKKRTRELIEMEIKPGTSLEKALSDFERVCDLRHCAVHCGGTLNAYNAKRLGLDKSYVRKVLQPSALVLQDALAVCYSFVRAFNQATFDRTIERWRARKLLSGNWGEDRYVFSRMLGLFWSHLDNGATSNPIQVYRSIFPGSTTL